MGRAKFAFANPFNHDFNLQEMVFGKKWILSEQMETILRPVRYFLDLLS
jgi:hypothetical protein